jgi:glycerol uptake facilitator-like aquaporin
VIDRPSLVQRLSAEAFGTCLLLATIVGSGIMGERLAGGQQALALLCNALSTGAILIVLVTMLGPVSGAHFNPAVTAAFLVKRDLSRGEAVAYVVVQVVAAVLGVLIAHAMFDLPFYQLSAKPRGSLAQGFSECVATLGLVATVLLTLRTRPEAIATAVGLYITAAYWFTASTAFANPAVTLARAFTDTFAGIALANVPLFVFAQLLGVAAALVVVRAVAGPQRRSARTAIANRLP